jgi:hypothetical protein
LAKLIKRDSIIQDAIGSDDVLSKQKAIAHLKWLDLAAALEEAKAYDDKMSRARGQVG